MRSEPRVQKQDDFCSMQTFLPTARSILRPVPNLAGHVQVLSGVNSRCFLLLGVYRDYTTGRVRALEAAHSACGHCACRLVIPTAGLVKLYRGCKSANH